ESGSSGFGGISPLSTRSQSKLSSRLPGTTTGPLDPPRAIDRGLLRLSFPLGLIGPWHFRQRAFNKGCTSRSRLGRAAPSPNPPGAEAGRPASKPAARTRDCTEPRGRTAARGTVLAPGRSRVPRFDAYRKRCPRSSLIPTLRQEGDPVLLG